MLLDKIQHYFRVVFIICLVFIQAMIFVATKASNSSDYNLSAVFMEPIVGYSIPAGEQVDIQAMLSTNDSNDFSVVYFTVASYDETISLNFNSESQGDGTWLALSAWDTINWPAGVYTLSATADVHDNNGILTGTYNSMPQLVNLVATAEEVVIIDEEVEMAAEDNDPVIATDLHFFSPDSSEVFPPGEVFYNPQTIDFLLEADDIIDIDATVTTLAIHPFGSSVVPLIEISSGYSGGYYGNHAVDVSELPPGEYSAFFHSAVNIPGGGGDEGHVPIVATTHFTIYRSTGLPPEARVVSPEPGDIVNGTIELRIMLTVSLQEEYRTIRARIYDSGGGEVLSETEMWELDDYYVSFLDTDRENNNGRMFPYSETYFIKFVAIPDSADFPERELATTSFFIRSVIYEVPQISLDEPADSDTIFYTDGLSIELSTNYEAENFTYELISQADHSMSTGEVSIDYVDGYNWSAVIELDDTFVTGAYDLIVNANLPADFDGDELTNTYSFFIEMPNDTDIDPDDVILELFNPGSSLSGAVDLVVDANYSGLNISFILEDTVTEEMYTYGAAEVSQQYAVNIDTTQLPNSNYNIYAKATVGTTGKLSDVVVATIFNTIEDDEVFWGISVWGLVGEQSDLFNLIVVSDSLDNSQGMSMFLTHQASSEVFEFFMPRSSWDEMEEIGYSRAGNENTHPYVYIKRDINSRAMFNGAYNVAVTAEGYSTREIPINLSVLNETGGIILRPLLVPDEISGEIDIWFASSHDSGVAPVFQNQATEEEFRYNAYLQESWNALAAEGVYQSDYASTPYLFHNTISTDAVPDGEYLYYIEYTNSGADTFELTSEPINVLVMNNAQDQAGDDVDQPEDDQAGGGGTISADAEVIIGVYTSCLDVGVTDQATCQEFRAMVDLLDEDCVEQGIYSQAACEDYLNTTIVDNVCQSEGIINAEDCRDYLLEKYGANVTCWLDNEETCRAILRDEYLNRLVVGQQEQEVIEEVVDSLLGQTLTVAELSQALGSKGIDSGVLPLSSESTKVYLAESYKETILEAEDKLTILNKAIIIIDTDGDGLSDDLEGYYGTDINNPDTDGDSYPDGTEINNGYNPLGEGRLETERTDFDEAILAGSVIEQPKDTSDKIDKKFKVQNVDNTESGLELKGIAAANTWITLFLYSDLPLVMTTQTDASGNWSYGIKDSLTDGHHRVFVTVNDNTGKIVKQSSPVSFLVKRAQAVTANNYFDTTTTQDSVDSMLVYYMIGAGLLVVLALAIIMFLHRGKKQDENIELQDG